MKLLVCAVVVQQFAHKGKSLNAGDVATFSVSEAARLIKLGLISTTSQKQNRKQNVG